MHIDTNTCDYLDDAFLQFTLDFHQDTGKLPAIGKQVVRPLQANTFGTHSLQSPGHRYAQDQAQTFQRGEPTLQGQPHTQIQILPFRARPVTPPATAPCSLAIGNDHRYSPSGAG